MVLKIMVFLKSSTLGRFACLPCMHFLSSRKTEQKWSVSTVFCKFAAGPRWPIPPDRRLPCAFPAVLRLCSSTGLFRGAVPKTLVQKTPSAPRPTFAVANCCGLAATLVVDHQRSSYFYVHTWAISLDGVSFSLFSVSVGSRYLKT